MQIKELKENEMANISGGTISSTFINAIVNVVSLIYDLGEKTGSTIRRLISGESCSVN